MSGGGGGGGTKSLRLLPFSSLSLFLFGSTFFSWSSLASLLLLAALFTPSASFFAATSLLPRYVPVVFTRSLGRSIGRTVPSRSLSSLLSAKLAVGVLLSRACSGVGEAIEAAERRGRREKKRGERRKPRGGGTETDGGASVSRGGTSGVEHGRAESSRVGSGRAESRRVERVGSGKVGSSAELRRRRTVEAAGAQLGGFAKGKEAERGRGKGSRARERQRASERGNVTGGKGRTIAAMGAEARGGWGEKG